MLFLVPPGADPEDQPPAGEVLDRGGRLREERGVAIPLPDDQGADLVLWERGGQVADAADRLEAGLGALLEVVAQPDGGEEGSADVGGARPRVDEGPAGGVVGVAGEAGRSRESRGLGSPASGGATPPSPASPRTRVGFGDLLRPLTRKSKHIARVSSRQPGGHQCNQGPFGCPGRIPGSGKRGLAEFEGPANTASHRGREANLELQVGPLGVRDPQRQGFADAPARLVDCPALSVGSRHVRDTRDPQPRRIAFDEDPIRRHFVHHLSPKHGARSRLIFDKSPGPMSSPA